MEEFQRVRVPKGVNEVLCIVEAKLGGNKIALRCQDGKSRIGRIPGRLKKSMWINIGSAVLVEKWDIDGDKRGDIVWQYTPTHKEWLRKKNLLTI